MKTHDHEYGDSGYCVHCHRLEPALDAEDRSARWLAKGNEYKEHGNKAKAEECYSKSAVWLMKANELRRW